MKKTLTNITKTLEMLKDMISIIIIKDIKKETIMKVDNREVEVVKEKFKNQNKFMIIKLRLNFQLKIMTKI
jgi:hypothetical protein